MDLEFRAFMHKVDGEPTPPLSPPLRGRLSVREFENNDLSLLGRLSDLPSEVER